ncbi:MAG: hypothetical protein HC767_01225 [Akkermansiaceae bacterium]|nr:hypothetical protein [Akkermansiaceae bacterium]
MKVDAMFRIASMHTPSVATMHPSVLPWIVDVQALPGAVRLVKEASLLHQQQ